MRTPSNFRGAVRGAMSGGNACAGLAVAVLEERTALSGTVGNLLDEGAERLTPLSTIRASRRGVVRPLRHYRLVYV
jgi:hypothetical protein